VTVRVLVVHPRDPAEPTSGGIQTFLHDFIAHSPDDFAISFAGLTSDRARRPVGKWLKIEVGGSPVRFLAVGTTESLVRHPLGLPRALPALARLQQELRRSPAILQIHRPYRSFLLRGHRGPRVQFIHLDLDAWPGPSGWQRLSWLYRDFTAELGRFDRIFVANEAGAIKLRHDNPAVADRVAFLSGWYDDATFHPIADADRPDQRGRLASTLGIPTASINDRWVLFVGRLDPIKDPGLAIDAFAALMELSAEPTRLIVCGDGSERERAALEARIAERGVANFTSIIGGQPRDVVAALMAAGDALLVTSVAEGGGPRVVLEALGSGLPVVSTIVGEVRRSVTSQRTGWLTDDRAPEALATGLDWALEQPREEISRSSVEAARPFVASAVLARLYETYRELAARTRSRTES
jgi:glycosyltransferase involved in cell wall biosynthesis